jgi:hypothetical protein
MPTDRLWHFGECEQHFIIFHTHYGITKDVWRKRRRQVLSFRIQKAKIPSPNRTMKARMPQPAARIIKLSRTRTRMIPMILNTLLTPTELRRRRVTHRHSAEHGTRPTHTTVSSTLTNPHPLLGSGLSKTTMSTGKYYASKPLGSTFCSTTLDIPWMYHPCKFQVPHHPLPSHKIQWRHLLHLHRM